MRLGIAVTSWDRLPSMEDQGFTALQAEYLGFDSVWIADGNGVDAVSQVAWLAASTTRIGIGTAAMQIPARPAVLTAMNALTLNTLSEGRFRLGIGESDLSLSGGCSAEEAGISVQQLADYIEEVRKALDRRRLRLEGNATTPTLADGQVGPGQLSGSPARVTPPILLVALGDNIIELAGATADGWIVPVMFAPEHADALRAPLDVGAVSAGRDPGDIEILVQSAVCVDDDIDAARNAIRYRLARVIARMGIWHNEFCSLASRYGFGDDVMTIRRLCLEGCEGEAAAAIPQELIDLVSICGPPERVRARLRDYERVGVDTLVLMPMMTRGSTLAEQIRRIGVCGHEYLKARPATN